MPATKGRHAYVRKRERLDAQGAFEFFLGPLDDVVELLVALRELRHHHGVDRLVVDLGADIRAGRRAGHRGLLVTAWRVAIDLSLIHISEPTRLGMISYAVFCLKKK